MNDDDYTIVSRFQAEFRGVVQYLRAGPECRPPSGNCTRVMHVVAGQDPWPTSTRPPAAKVLRRYQSTVDTEHGPTGLSPRSWFERGTRENPLLWHSSVAYPLKRQAAGRPRRSSTQTIQAGTQRVDFKRLLADKCETVRGTTDEHSGPPRPRSSRPESKGPRREKPMWMRTMAARRRKTLVVCRKCHMDIHHGRITPQSQRRQDR